MDYHTGRADHIEDYLVTVRTGQWFGWSDFRNKIYANLVVHDGGAKPTEKECVDGLKAMQDAFDSTQYQRSRQREYPDWGTQLDYIYHNGIDKWKTDIVDPVKKKYPKPE